MYVSLKYSIQSLLDHMETCPYKCLYSVRSLDRDRALIDFATLQNKKKENVKNTFAVYDVWILFTNFNFTYSEQLFRGTLTSPRLLTLQEISVKFCRPSRGQIEHRQFLLHSVELSQLINMWKGKKKSKNARMTSNSIAKFEGEMFLIYSTANP